MFVLLALIARGAKPAGYAELAAQTGLAVSALHASLKRAELSRLLMFEARRPTVFRAQLQEFVLHGAKYAFPAVSGGLSRGLPTGYEASERG